MMTRAASAPPMPAYRRILLAVRERIESGALKPGDRIDSERRLAEVWNVSLMTARHALKELENEGLLERHVGLGTFVAPPKVHFNRLLSFSEQMAARGVTAASRFVARQITRSEPEAAARLGLPPETALLKLQRIRFGGGEPFALETTFLSNAAYPNVAKRLRSHGSLFEVLEREYQVRLAYADEEVDATAADAHTARYLGVPRGSPVLRIRQTSCAENGQRLLYDLGLYRSDRHSLTIRRFR